MKNFVILGFLLAGLFIGGDYAFAEKKDNKSEEEISLEFSSSTKKIIILNQTGGKDMYVFFSGVMITARDDKKPSPIKPGKAFVLEGVIQGRSLDVKICDPEKNNQEVGCEHFFILPPYNGLPDHVVGSGRICIFPNVRIVFKEEEGQIRNHLEFPKDEDLEKGDKK